VAFVKSDDGTVGAGDAIYLAAADGTSIRNLTEGSAGRFQGLTWDPDGERMAFVWERDGVSDLFVMDVASGTIDQITDTPVREFHSQSSPDGNHIAFLEYQGGIDDSDALVVIEWSGANRQVLLDGNGILRSPAWSPDAARIGFSRWMLDDTLRDLAVVRSDGTEPTGIGRGLAPPAWTLDSEWLLFAALHPDEGLHLVRFDGTDPTPLVSAGRFSQCAWSPDRTLIAVRDNGGVHVLDAAGESKTKVADQAARFVWSPDGQWIATAQAFLVCLEDDGFCYWEQVNLVIVSIDGDRHIRVTDYSPNEGWDSELAWRPR
jgi:dipeptidyl aminopeptidase/acylaminoacyl peptidase